MVGPPGSTGQVGMSDAGEPHGTAGRPMLTVLQHSDVGDIVAVVTRYFGGTLLGKGGLVKAYSGGVQLALASAPRTERVPRATVAVVIDYSAVTLFQRMAPDFEVDVEQEEYGVDVSHIAAATAGAARTVHGRAGGDDQRPGVYEVLARDDDAAG
ncbi:MAG: YigZ family protein [Caldilineaceae bacterium]